MDEVKAANDNVRVADEPHPRHRIREWRRHRGYTLEALAAEIGTTHATLSRIETGKGPYSQPIIEALADVLDVDLGTLLTLTPQEAKSVATLWVRIPEDRRPLAARMLNSMSESEIPLDELPDHLGPAAAEPDAEVDKRIAGRIKPFRGPRLVSRDRNRK